MALISVDSPKGGVGKTTCAANLAYGIRRLGYRVAVIDFDPQNALRLHFGCR
ncbi:Septum site-determining protein MinD [Alcanivorax sp. ALC70]|nr:Septum site-determining protein MinD [Alcanivorax sp. ALC70]